MAYSLNRSPGRLSEVIQNIYSKSRKRRGLQIDRGKLFDEVVTFLIDSRNSDHFVLDVEFVSDAYREPAHDTGGLTRELFTLFFQECLGPSRNMFDGERIRVAPSNNQEALEKRWYYCLGKAIVISLVLGGPGFPYLSKSSFSFLTDADLIDILPDLKQDIPRKLLKLIEKIDNAKSEEELMQISRTAECKQLETHIQENDSMILKMTNKLTFTQKVCKWYLLDSRKDSLNQLKEGFQTWGFLPKAKRCYDLQWYLVHSPEFCVDGNLIREKILPKLTDLDDKNSEKKILIKELAAQCLLGINDDQAKDLFQFITGMRDLPVEDIDISVEYDDACPNNKLPRAITCLNLLLLPQGNTDEKGFIASFKTALEYRTTFGRI